jgi:hypothetical protein
MGTCGPECAGLVKQRKAWDGMPLDAAIRAYLGGRTTKGTRGAVSMSLLADVMDRSPKTIRAALDVLSGQGYNVQLSADVVVMSSEVKPGNVGGTPLVHDISAYVGQWFQFGALGDNHLGSKHERLDVLNAAYDLYAAEGVTTVFNTGNWIEGEMRLNFHDVKVHGLDAQVDYFLEHYPQRPGIVTYYVAGDDHCGWYQRNNRMEIGRYVERRAVDAGRHDLKYLGYVEADVLLKAPKGHSLLRVMHPGGGSAYAHSYAPQKIVESFQGGEKPHVLLIGHYHKFEYCYPREVHVVQTGCTVDQSIFMRKQKIQAMVGFTLCRLNQDAAGIINRFQCEWFPFYDRGFYGKARRHFGLTKQPMPVLTMEHGKLAA